MNMLEIGVLLKLSDQMTGGMRNAMGSLDSFGGKLDQLAEKSNRMGRASIANGMILAGLMTKPIHAFADLDEASTNLRVAMMDNLGRIPPQFAEINKQAIELGNILPGTTADFTNAATALIENGTALDQVIGGGLKAASYLSVILRMAPRDAAEMVAKFREAYGLSEHELTKMADLTQKAKFAFGVNPDDIKYSTQYMGPALHMLHLTGVENAKLMLAMQGYARQQGMPGQEFGTNFAQMLNQMGQLESKLGRNSKPMHEVNKELAQYGIHMEFFNKQGKFVGLEGMVGQLEKLRVLSEQQKIFITNKMFGMEGGRPASLLAEMGTAGLQKNLALMDRQADLMRRIDEVTKSAKNTWEAFTGTVTNLMAAFGGPAVDFLKPYITMLNEITGGPLQKFVEEHKTMATVIGLGALAFGALAIGIGAVGLAVGGLARAGSLLGMGKKGVAGALGGVAGGMPIPLPVFIVNGKMSLLPGQLGGEPTLPGEGPVAKAGVGSKLMSGLNGLLKLAASYEVGQYIGGLINNNEKLMNSEQKDEVGREIAWVMALLGDKDAREALDRMKIAHDAKDIKGEIRIHVDSEGHATAEVVNSTNRGIKYQAYTGNTMVTQ